MLPRRFLTPALLVLGAAMGSAQTGPEFVRHSVGVPGAKISYLVRQRSGPMLVLIPGSFNTASVFAEMIRSLNSDLSIMVVEMRGHGGSWPPPVHGSIPQFAGDVLRAVDAAGIRKFYVGGHSIGGMVAIEVAGQRPQALKGVISIEGWTHYSVQQTAFHGLKLETMTPAKLALRTRFADEVKSRWTAEQVKDFLTIWRSWSGLAILRNTQLAVLEIWGDRNRPPASRKSMQIPDRPNIELEWIHGAGHSLPVEAPEKVAALINKFLTKMEAHSR